MRVFQTKISQMKFLFIVLLFLFSFTNISSANVLLEEKLKTNEKILKITNENFTGTYKEGSIEIEILELNKIPGGIEVLARAWNGGKQIGFGPDGSVDVERFRIYNPPTLIPDNFGEITRNHVVDFSTQETFQTNYRSNPKEAVIKMIFKIIAAKKEKDYKGNRIQAGKIGNTTSTFFSEADPASTAGDGTWNAESYPTWSSVHSLSSSTLIEGSNLIARTDRISSSDWRIGRAYVNFDTSVLENALITSASLNVTLGGNGIDILNHARQVALVEFFGSSPDAVADDFDQVGNALSNPTEGAQRINLSLGQQAGTDYTFNLNATGTSWINKTGVSKFGLRSSLDVDNTAPSNDGQGRAQFYSADASGTTNDPHLIVEHFEPSTIQIFAESNDGYTTNSYCNEPLNWSTVRNATTSFDVCNNQNIIKVRSDAEDGAYQIYRASFIFDTSVLPDNATITAASLNIFGTSTGGSNNANIVITSHTRSSSTLLSPSDWQISTYGSTLFGSTSSNLLNANFNQIDLNNDGLEHISKSNNSIFGILTYEDFASTDPGASRTEATFTSSKAPGTSTDPYLEITYY